MAAANTHSYRVVVIGGGGGSGGGGGGDIGESVAVGVASDLVFPNEVYFCSSLLSPLLPLLLLALWVLVMENCRNAIWSVCNDTN